MDEYGSVQGGIAVALQPTAFPSAFGRARAVFGPALRGAVDRIDDHQMRAIAGYQLGWLDADGRPVEGRAVERRAVDGHAPSGPSGGKAVRPTLAVLSAEAGGGSAADGVPAAVAVELVHNFSLLHDDVMDRDVERRHRPTGWVVFGESQAILAGNAMLTAAFDVLVRDGEPGRRALPHLVASVQQLIGGQSADLLLQNGSSLDLDAVLQMESGKTAALIACSASIGAIAAGASLSVVAGLASYGHELGMAFQLVDDILGITGDEAVTGKSSSSDVRAGKRSAPIVAALVSRTRAAAELAGVLGRCPLSSDADVTQATKLIDEAGGLEWAAREAERKLAAALAQLDELAITATARTELAQLARYVVERDR